MRNRRADALCPQIQKLSSEPLAESTSVTIPMGLANVYG